MADRVRVALDFLPVFERTLGKIAEDATARRVGHKVQQIGYGLRHVMDVACNHKQRDNNESGIPNNGKPLHHDRRDYFLGIFLDVFHGRITPILLI